MQIAGVELEDLTFDSIGSWPKILRIILIIAVGALTIFLAYKFYLSDLYDKYLTLEQERFALQASFEKAYDQASNLEEYKKQVITVEKSLETLTRQLPKSSEEAGILDDITRQAISSGLVFQAFKPLPEKSQGFYIEHPIELTLQGGYHNFGEFASNVASMPRIVTIHDFTIKSVPGNPKQLNINVTVQTYWSTHETMEEQNPGGKQITPAPSAPHLQSAVSYLEKSL